MNMLEKAIAAIDDANSADPNRVLVNAQPVARELVYGQQMSQWLARLEPNPSESLQIAARAQHICRWELPRTAYPNGRIGYLQWRTALYNHHANRVEHILRDIGYDSSTIQHVRQLVRKQGLKTDADAQTLEDTACLVFFEFELADFMTRQPPEKLTSILQKTWKKMSPRGQSAALALPNGKIIASAMTPKSADEPIP